MFFPNGEPSVEMLDTPLFPVLYVGFNLVQVWFFLAWVVLPILYLFN